MNVRNTVIFGDALDGLKLLESESVDTCITSPPYYNLRDYGKDGQIGRETTPEEYRDIGHIIKNKIHRLKCRLEEDTNESKG